MARPTKLIPETEERLLLALRAGNTRRAACALASISEDSLAAWLHRFSDFSDAIKKAEAEANAASVARIRQAAAGGQLLRETTVTRQADRKSTRLNSSH